MFLSITIFKVKRSCPDQNYNPVNTEFYVVTYRSFRQYIDKPITLRWKKCEIPKSHLH